MTTQQLKIAAAGNKAVAVNPAVDALNKAMSGISAILPAHITPARMAKLSLGVLRTNEKLAQAAKRNPASFVNAIMGASRLGLEPGIDAHLVPFENKKQGSVEITMIPDYRGLLKIARNSGEITSVSVQIVYQHDQFDLELGLDEKLVHKPKLDGPRGEPLLVYGVARFRDGAHHVEWMSVEDVNAIRDESQGYKTAKRFGQTDAPWISDWPEMARKTLVRRMCKYLPRSVELMNAERIIEAADKGKTAQFDGDFVVVDEGAEALENVVIGDGDVTTDAVRSDVHTGRKEREDGPRATPAQPNADAIPAPTVTMESAHLAASIEAKLKEAKDVEVLDAHADLIREVDDPARMAELTALYRGLRKKMTEGKT